VIAAPDKRTADILLDMLDKHLSISIKCQGYLDVFNGINITQTHNYIKINCYSFVEKACKKNLTSWMHTIPLTDNRPTPLPTDSTWLKKFKAAISSLDKTEQDWIAMATKLNYCGGVGELMWAHLPPRPCVHQCQIIPIKLPPS
jgi:hypothetical protein